LQQLLVDTAFAARQRFPGKPLRVWYVMLNRRAWRGIIINTANKVKLAEGPIRATRKAALVAVKNQLEAAVRKTS
jgi:hypothetical protein